MSVKPFIERDAAIGEFAPYPECSMRGWGLYSKRGWCLFGVEYQPGGMSSTGSTWPWTFTLIVWNIAFGLWNDPD